jgi:uncharacterized damage-inducible protein DinB
MHHLSYPIGLYEYKGPHTPAQRAELIAQIQSLPQRIRAAASDLTTEQLDTPYRPGGWTVRQLLHHVPDSHANGYIRTKLALTEDTPTIKPYEEQHWAELPDTNQLPIESALSLLDALHTKWVAVWQLMTDEQFARCYFHPASQQSVSLDEQLGLYAWHGNHHLAHLTALRERLGW